jgi:ubiquitin carboxyl-terminal hydrolase MINDY-1/2
LSSTSTQLSYHGLFVLAQSLQPGEIVTLFRNSHLSVLYRRLPTEGAAEEQGAGDLLGAGAAAAGQQYPGEEVPQLFTLATDSAFLMEDEVVWESLADMDQAASEFYDGKFRKTRLEGDWVGVDARGRRRPHGAPGRGGAGYDGAIVDESGRVIPPGEDAE